MKSLFEVFRFEPTPDNGSTSYCVNGMWSPVRERRRSQRDFSRIELLLGIAILLLLLWFLILSTILKMETPTMQVRERGAIATLKTIHTVQIQYRSQFGHYATSLAQLGPPAEAGRNEDAQAANLIPGSLASGSSPLLSQVDRKAMPRAGSEKKG